MTGDLIRRARRTGPGRWGLVLLTLVVTAAPAAADLEIGASLDRTRVAVGDQLVLTVSVDGEVRDVRAPEIPDLPGLEIYGGGQSQRFNFVNGRVSAQHSFTFYLRPQREGNFSLDGITIEVDGREKSVAPVEFEVVGRDRRAPAEPAPQPSDREPGEPFVTLSADRDSVVVGQQIVLTFSYYRPGRSSFFDSPQYREPRTEGFWREELPGEQRRTRVIQSRRYEVTELRYALFPTHAGELEIGAAELTIRDDPMGSFFRSRRSRGPRTLRTESIPIHVDPLPPTGGRDFSGTVGRGFRLDASVDRQELAAGEALTLQIRLEGEGHLASARDPEVGELEDFRVHDAGGASRSRPVGGRLHGAREVEKLLIPSRPGRTTIPPIEYVVFDTEEMRYRTLRTDPIEIEVLPAEDGGGASVMTGGRKSEIELLARDILHIRPIAPDLSPVGRPLVDHPLFLGLLALPALVWLGSGRLARRRRALHADPARLRAARALRVARETLRGEGRADRRVDQALRGFVADRANVAAAGLRREDLDERMRDMGCTDDDRRRMHDLLDRCDALRFAPGGGEDGSLVEEAAAFLEELDGRMRRAD